MAQFNVGRVGATVAAVKFCHDSGISMILDIIYRHTLGQWGDVSPEIHVANDIAIRIGGPLISMYTFELGKVYVITDSDRSHTSVMLVEEYETKIAD